MTVSLSRIGIWILAGGVVIAVANAAARLTWSLAGETGAQVTDIATALAEPSRERPLDLAPIFALAPFGTAATAAAPEPVAQETSLGLVLRGIVVAEPARDSIAVIASAAGDAKVYGVGDSVDGKAILQAVLGDRVMLEVGDRVETLSFPKPGQNTGVANIVAGIPNSGIAAASPSAGKPQTPIIEDYRRKIALNPKSVLDSFGISPSKDGYTIGQNTNSSVLRAGLRPGDRIAKVNGEQVGDIERDRGLVDQIIASGRVRVEVVRDGRTVVMSFPLQ